MAKAWLAPAAWIYGGITALRNKFYDWGWLRSEEFDIPIVCVGNLTVGGTGKTPVVEMLIRALGKQWNVAVLSRGYKRKTKGYLEVEAAGSFIKSGDEPKQIKRKFPEIVVAVCEDRAEGIRTIRRNHPQVNLIIMDDGFQHRSVEPWISIILMDATRPIYNDHMLPWGNLRDNPSQLHRANYVLVTKCPRDMSPLDRRLISKSLKLYPYQGLYFTTMETGRPMPMFRDGYGTEVPEGAGVIVMSGIGNPDSFRYCVQGRFKVVGVLEYPDHHPYHSRDLEDMRAALENAPQGAVILATEKDAVKLTGSKKIPEELRKRMFYLPATVSFSEETKRHFLNNLYENVRTNPKHGLIHSK